MEFIYLSIYRRDGRAGGRAAVCQRSGGGLAVRLAEAPTSGSTHATSHGPLRRSKSSPTFTLTPTPTPTPTATSTPTPNPTHAPTMRPYPYHCPELFTHLG